ncbi:YdcF family protein [Saccharopolyspora sp. CA-218241]|uniref:YdcF family protein n=1 Tax=Saccharopolyspora sp. CA-218241 TaxID=3240027 RepID=UPI003D99248A
MTAAAIPTTLHDDVRTLWDYHDMHHELRPTDVGIGLGSHDLGVATCAAELYHVGWFPQLVFTGATAPTTAEVFPNGEAVHYREHARSLGVPDAAILVEPRATNTGENIGFSRAALHRAGIHPRSVTLVCRPYQQRRAYATCRAAWPEVEVLCASRRQPFEEYVAALGVDRVITMLVGDTQRITVHARNGFAIPQEVPAEVEAAYDRLVAAGYTDRLLPG